ncbi:hypothetical protein [Nocardia arthritidis]|uniref:DUF732 domain-containing protein n=1 Tax=Nocardia arthritidis TaxID=228602 RepID=A0A6G9YCC0_9NOCA|nr:hypothetical protein [Nocardia arthritidis]QIS10818.1 hypothetical protein F5544_14670 [Nocardia arthritidis]
MIRTTAAIAACATAFALLLTGCGSDKASSSAPASAAATSAKPAAPAGLDNVKAGAFVVAFKNAFPKLADGKDDTKIAGVLSDTCTDIKAGKPEDAVVKGVGTRVKSASADATTEESQAIYQMAKLMCG